MPFSTVLKPELAARYHAAGLWLNKSFFEVLEERARVHPDREVFSDAGRRITFHTRSGPLTATPLPSGEIELNFPAKPASPAEPPPGLLDALGTTAIWVGRNQFDYLVELAGELLFGEQRRDRTGRGDVAGGQRRQRGDVELFDLTGLGERLAVLVDNEHGPGIGIPVKDLADVVDLR